MSSGQAVVRTTLSLPKALHSELDAKAKEHGTTLVDVVRLCLKFGLIAMEIEQKPDAEIVFRERIAANGSVETKETSVRFVW